MINSLAKYLLLMICVFLISNSWAEILVEPPESVSQEVASGVFIVRIEKKEMLSAGGTFCGGRYHASILKSIKGDFSKHDIVFGIYANLETGREYKIYLKPRLTRSQFVANLTARGIDATEAEEWVSKCHDLIPQHIYFRSIKLNQNQVTILSHSPQSVC